MSSNPANPQRAAWAPLTQGFLGAALGESSTVFLVLVAEDYARDCGPLGFVELSIADVVERCGLPARTVQRHLQKLRKLGATESRRHPNSASRTYIHYEAVGLPALEPTNQPDASGRATYGATESVSELAVDSVTPEMAHPVTPYVARPNSISLCLIDHDREREIELEDATNGATEDATSGATDIAAVIPIGPPVQPPLPASSTHLRYMLNFSFEEMQRLQVAFPRVNVDERWRQWLAWVAVDVPNRLPKDKFGAFYGWLKRSLDAGSGKDFQRLAKQRASPDEQLQRDMDRFRRQMLDQLNIVV